MAGELPVQLTLLRGLCFVTTETDSRSHPKRLNYAHADGQLGGWMVDSCVTANCSSIIFFMVAAEHRIDNVSLPLDVQPDILMTE